jgi:hypothetical protein
MDSISTWIPLKATLERAMIMPKWKKDETKFTVAVNHNETRGDLLYIPKPIMELLGEPDRITFEVKPSKKIEVKGERSEG